MVISGDSNEIEPNIRAGERISTPVNVEDIANQLQRMCAQIVDDYTGVAATQHLVQEMRASFAARIGIDPSFLDAEYDPMLHRVTMTIRTVEDLQFATVTTTNTNTLAFNTQTFFTNTSNTIMISNPPSYPTYLDYPRPVYPYDDPVFQMGLEEDLPTDDD